MFCFKTLTKIPMAAVGVVDLIACGADKAICKLAKRGEKAVSRMRKETTDMHCCTCEGVSICDHP